ncbi:hypothetical protein F5X68DRAFT_239483 [Plectosphaerella plurivora]|uniref:Heterokaryon incompatibility domain-containing protein n=1 Tax=Plectosphaerella plurivora TaxID=936078 RepID=A0A9P8VD14_9PEZI|nr:hypothetical protein F5X68DRAFT_239483 [Plectosphaerella plurivora]
MSCQATMRASHAGTMPSHTHIARAVAGCCMILRECLPTDSSEPRLRHAFHDCMAKAENENGEEDGVGDYVNIYDVVEIIYWMATTQYHQEIGPERFGRWGSKLLPDTISYNSLNIAHDSLDQLQDAGYCKARIWGLVEVCDRKEADLVGIVAALDRNTEWLVHDKNSTSENRTHRWCVANRCQTDHVNTASVPLAHKCDDRKCGNLLHVEDKMQELRSAVEKNTSTAWHFIPDRNGLLVPDRLSNPGEKYMAVSHAWADGTGGRFENVNVCLFDYFARKARDLGCEAIWWDSISVPSGEGRGKALQTMNLRYSEADVTLVHSNYLLGIESTKPETRCLGIVLSGWYTRMWTAMELAKSANVKVMFGWEQLVDLKDVLVQGPEECSRAHWMACSSIRRLREPVNDLGDLISVLRPRTTSNFRDRTIVALNLAEVPEAFWGSVDDECDMTRQLLKYLGRIPQNCLLHGKPTIQKTGPFSWCPANLDDLPTPTSQTNMKSRETGELISMLRVSLKGVVTGEWWCRDLGQVCVAHNVLPYGTDRSSTVKTELALQYSAEYLLISPAAQAKEDAALLVMPLRVTSTSIHCRYIGAVKVVQRAGLGPAETEQEKDWHLINISLGDEERENQSVMEASAAVGEAHENDICLLCSKDPRAQEVETTTSGYSRDHQYGSLLLDLNRLSSLVRIQPEPEPNELPDHTPTKEHLIRAVQAEREKSIKYLVGQGINLEQDDLDRLLPNKATVCGLWALGSVLTLTTRFEDLDRAITTFSKAIELCEQLSFTNSGGNSWLSSQLQLNHGRLCSVLRPDVGMGGVPPVFKEVLNACRNESNRRCDRTAAGHANRRHWGVQQQSHRRWNTSWAYQATEQAQVPDLDLYGPWDCTLEGWERLEWDTLAELILVNVEIARYDKAADWYCDALVQILAADPADDERRDYLRQRLRNNEAFDERHQHFMRQDDVIPERVEDLNTRSKRYATALRWFQYELSRDHILVSLTRLHAGVSLAFEGQWTEAEKHLRQALKDFESRLVWHPQHAIIAFAQYHLGKTVGHLGIHRGDAGMTAEARKLLTKSRDYFANSTSDWMREATQWELEKVAQEEARLNQARLDEAHTEGPEPDLEEEVMDQD